MTLSTNQKKELDTAIEQHITDFINVQFSMWRIAQALQNEVNSQLYDNANSIYHSVKRVCDKKGYTLRRIGRYNDETRYAICPVYMEDIKMVKERNLLNLISGDKIIVSYNFDTTTVNMEDDSLKIFIPKDYQRLFFELHNLPEWIFNYQNNVSEILQIINNCDKEVYKECPKGFINYLKETEQKFTRKVLEEYYYKSILGVPGYNLYKTLENRMDSDEAFEAVKFLVDNNLYKMFTKILVTTVKNGNFVIPYGTVKYFIEMLTTLYKADKNIVNQLDTNRDLEVNYKTLEEAYKQERLNILASQLKKLNFINGLEYKDLIVVVPQNQAEKKEEGKMQNNCVGYYYDESILAGDNFIYFIRKKADPAHSYITCRFNKGYKKTNEYRAVNNSTVRDQDAIQFIKELDTIINENYAKIA